MLADPVPGARHEGLRERVETLLLLGKKAGACLQWDVVERMWSCLVSASVTAEVGRSASPCFSACLVDVKGLGWGLLPRDLCQPSWCAPSSAPLVGQAPRLPSVPEDGSSRFSYGAHRRLRVRPKDRHGNVPWTAGKGPLRGGLQLLPVLLFRGARLRGAWLCVSEESPFLPSFLLVPLRGPSLSLRPSAPVISGCHRGRQGGEGLGRRHRHQQPGPERHRLPLGSRHWGAEPGSGQPGLHRPHKAARQPRRGATGAGCEHPAVYDRGGHSLSK